MRSEAAIHAMRDQLFVRWATVADETGVDEIRTALGWVLNPSMPDSELLDLIVKTADDDELRPEDVLHGLAEATEPGNINTRDYLYRLDLDEVTALAAAARRLDRMCKAEIKKRGTPK